jgi:hypothetical protein
MKTKLQIIVLIVVLPLIFNGCTGTPTTAQPALTLEECGPFPENFAKITEDYSKTTKIFAFQSQMQFTVLVTVSQPRMSNDRLHPGWRVNAQREFLSTAGNPKTSMSMPLQIIIYDGKIVWSSDERYTK